VSVALSIIAVTGSEPAAAVARTRQPDICLALQVAESIRSRTFEAVWAHESLVEGSEHVAGTYTVSVLRSATGGNPGLPSSVT
jgi:hypothetical protein